jgi:hypothetical protein
MTSVSVALQVADWPPAGRVSGIFRSAANNVSVNHRLLGSRAGQRPYG